jgi:choline kinase
MKAIIVAAGPGSLLNPFTNERPKCLLDIGGRTILERALEALRGNGIEDIAVVRGYRSYQISYPNITYYENRNFRKNNILRSVFYAEGEMDDDFIFSYSDIIYSREVVKRLIDSEADIGLIVDIDWIHAYEGRNLHPVSEAELVKVKNGKVVRIGKGVVRPDEARGEFIGLAKFTKSGADAMKAAYHRVAEERPAAPFQHAASLDKAYMTDMIQELIDTGKLVQSIEIESGWIEIDTPQDLERARKLFGT